MLTDAGPCAGAEPAHHEGWDVIALGFPPFRPKSLRVLEVFLRVVIALVLEAYICPLPDGQAIEIVVISGLPHEDSVDGPIHPGCFLLDPVNVHQIFQILIAVVIAPHVFVNSLAKGCLNLRVLGNVVDHGHQVMGGSVGPSHKECAEFL